MQIIFGTKKLTESVVRNASTEKYPQKAVVTVEGVKGHKKARRILFNLKACEELNLEVGSSQKLVFAPIHDTKQVLIANMDTIDEDARGEMISYKTSKNKVAYGGESTEKGKAATTSFMCKELFSFFHKEDSVDLEFELNEFPSESVEAYSLDLIEEVHTSLIDVDNIDELSEGAQGIINEVVENPIENSGEEKLEVIPTVDEMVTAFATEEIPVDRVLVEENLLENISEEDENNNLSISRRVVIS